MAWTNYVNTGPFANNTTPPGISATFLNNVESFLDQFAGTEITDANITSNGNGNLSVKTISLTAGSITRIAKINSTGTGSNQTVSHSLGAVPDFAIVMYAGDFSGNSPVDPAYPVSYTSSQVTIHAQNGYSYYALLIKF